MSQSRLLARFRDKDKIVLELSVCLCFKSRRWRKVDDEIILCGKNCIRVDVFAVSIKDLFNRRGGGGGAVGDGVVVNSLSQSRVGYTCPTHLRHQPLVAFCFDEKVDMRGSHWTTI